jgi:PKD domain
MTQKWWGRFPQLVVVAVCTLIIGLLIARALAAPNVSKPVVVPPSIPVGKTTELIVTSDVGGDTGNPLIPSSVNSLRVDTGGDVVAMLGTMRDDGTNGDQVAGDGTFTLRLAVTEQQLGEMRLQVSAAFQGLLKRVLSEVAAVPIEVNQAPVASAGLDQTVFVGKTVQLDGSKFSDADGDPLTFHWAFRSIPAGSTATLSDSSAVQPTFVVDRPGTYELQLIVNDGVVESAPDTVVSAPKTPAPWPMLGLIKRSSPAMSCNWTAAPPAMPTATH